MFDLIHDKFIVIQNVDEAEAETEPEEDDEMSDLEKMIEDDYDMISSDMEMEDELQKKTFEKELDPKVRWPLPRI